MGKRTVGILFLCMLIITVNSPFIVLAKDDHVGYSVQAMIPDNQINPKHSYFNLFVEPEQQQDLQVVIYNNENEAIDVRVAVHNASTNRNGLVVYEPQEETDPSLAIPLSEILTLEEEIIRVPAGESTTLTAQLDMPEDPFDGIILGGLHFEKIIEEDEATEGVQLQNKYAYVIGVQLSENDNEVVPELHLTSIEPTLVNYRTSVVAYIQNSEPVLISDLKVSAEVYKHGENELLKEKEQIPINIAPNSTLAYTIDWENEPLAPGEYILKMKAEHEFETWEWEEEFTVEKADAMELNKDAVELQKSGISNLWYVAGIAILITIIISLVLYIWMLKRKQNNNDINEQ